MNLFTYEIANANQCTPGDKPGLCNYLMAGNGVWLKAQRPGLSALIPLASLPSGKVRGLPDLKPSVEIPFLVPKDLVLAMWRESLLARDSSRHLIEIVFHLWLDGDRWHLSIPQQTQSAASCQPLEQGSYQKALIEVHSHCGMSAFFSGTDNADETGFRIYAVLGRIDSSPEIAVRVGIYGDYLGLNPSEIFELPTFIAAKSS